MALPNEDDDREEEGAAAPAPEAADNDAPSPEADDDTEGGGQLSRCNASTLSQSGKTFTIGMLEAEMLREFPSEDAESWDRNGLLVGDPALPVKKVAVALDPTVAAISEAVDVGANVLITHHPAYLGLPDSFAPASSPAKVKGAGVWAAIRNDVALMDFHTPLDVSPRTASVLAGMLGLSFTGRFVEAIPSSVDKGYGQVCTMCDDGEAGTLSHLAARCTSVFGRPPRVWGDFRTQIRTVVTATGSAGSLLDSILDSGADCLICGEIKYHDALNLSQAGLSIIELGHDVSELPLVAVLADALVRIGLTQDAIMLIDQSSNWHYPEAIRV